VPSPTPTQALCHATTAPGGDVCRRGVHLGSARARGLPPRCALVLALVAARPVWPSRVLTLTHPHTTTATTKHTHTHDTTPPPAYSPSVRVRVRSAFWWLAGASGLQSCVPQSAADCSSPGCDANSSTAGVQRHLAVRKSPSMTLIAGAPSCSSQKPMLARRARPCTPLR